MEPISSDVYGETVVIGSADYPSPLTITSSGKVEPTRYPYQSSDYGLTAISSDTSGVSLYNSGTIIGGVSASGGVGGIGVDFTASATVKNYGQIDGGKGNTRGPPLGGTGGEALQLTGGTLDNYSYITGGNGSYGDNGGTGVTVDGGTVLNSGGKTTGATIAGGQGHAGGSGGIGIVLTVGSVTNGTPTDPHSSTIEGGAATPTASSTGNGGIGIQMAANTQVTNYYQISGGAGGSGSGTAGGDAIDAGQNSTVKNYDNIKAGYGTSVGGIGVDLAGSAKLTNYAGSVITGGESAGTAGVGVNLAGYKASATNDGTIAGGESISSTLAAGVGANVAAGATLTNTDEIQGGYGLHAIGGAGVYLNGGTVTTSGRIYGGDNAVTHVYADAVQFGSVTGGTLVVQSGAEFNAGDVGGFRVGDYIDLTGISVSQAEDDWNSTTKTLTTGSANEGTLVFQGSYTGAQYQFRSIDGGTETQMWVTCYLRGTRIRAEQGDVAIETLRIGDRVMTQSGALRPIRWIGRRRYSSAVATADRDLLPVRFHTGALGENLPLRDLWVSPEHAMWIDGELIPARELINGHSILQDDSVGELTYFHLEFHSHDVIYAEGALAESFVDDESRLLFDNVAEYFTLYPDARPVPARFCAPRVEEGEELEAVRQRLTAIGAALSSAPLRSQAFAFHVPASLDPQRPHLF